MTLPSLINSVIACFIWLIVGLDLPQSLTQIRLLRIAFADRQFLSDDSKIATTQLINNSLTLTLQPRQYRW
jgi:hypothetical protein